MASFIKRHKKFLLFFVFVFSVGLFLISYFSKRSDELVVRYALQQCETNTGYSVAYDVEADYHKDKTISHILVEGAIEEGDSTYRRIDDEITIFNILDTDINNVLESENKINYDPWDKEVYSADFNGEKIGKGAIFIEVLYWDDFGVAQTETMYYTNVFDGAAKDSKKELIKVEKKECNIRILLVYKVTNKYGTSSEDFKVNYLLKVRNGAKDEVCPVAIGPSKSFADEIPAQVPANTDIIKGSTIFNGFYLDFTGNQFYTVKVYRNGELVGNYIDGYNYLTIRAVNFTDEGVYRIVTKNAFNEEDEFFITVDRYKPRGMFMNLDLDGKNTFSGFTSFRLEEPLGGFENRSKVTMEIIKDGGSYVNYLSGDIISETGNYSIRLENDLYTNIIYNFTIVDIIKPLENYNNLTSLNKDIRPTKYYAFDILIDSKITTYCFALDNYDRSFAKAKELEWDNEVEKRNNELYIYRNTEYYSLESITDAVNSYVGQNIYIKYADIFTEENLKFDQEMFCLDEIPYLNDFIFTTKGPIFSDTVYYLRQEDYPEIKELNLETAKLYKCSTFKYNIPVAEQLTLSGTYLILDTNIYGQTVAFKAFFVNENNAKIEIDYAVNQSYQYTEVTADKNELPAIVDYFKITFMNDIYDPYTIVKVVFGDQVDYYTAQDIKTGPLKSYNKNGIYYIVCYDRNLNYFDFEITVENDFTGGIKLEGVGKDFTAYDDFKIYFDIDCAYLNIKENGTRILLIENGEIQINVYGLQICDSVEGFKYITIEKKSGIYYYHISFRDKDGNLEEYIIGLI